MTTPAFLMPLRRSISACLLMGVILLSFPPPLLAETDPPCGNPPFDPPTCNSTKGNGNPYDVIAGNVRRSVVDLALAAGVGRPLRFERHSMSRYDPTVPTPLGAGASWRHNWQWRITALPPVNEILLPGQGPWERLQIDSPEGVQTSHRGLANAKWFNPEVANDTARVCYEDPVDGKQPLSLVFSDGARLRFERIGAREAESRTYRLLEWVDPHGLAYAFDLDDKGRVIRVTEPGGRYLEIVYGLVGDYTVLNYKFSVPVGFGLTGPGESLVSVTVPGDFNGWNVNGSAMSSDPVDPTRLSVVVPLQAVTRGTGGGTNTNAYQYKFYVTKDTPGGRVSVWLHDPANPARLGDNCALEVVNFNSYLDYSQARPVAFSYHPGRAVRSVEVRGAFNSWNGQAMTMDPDGTWRWETTLLPGQYPYKFYVEEEPGGTFTWATDPNNPFGRSDGNGSFNSVLCVGPFDEAITEVRASDGRMVSYSYSVFESGAAIFSTLQAVNYYDGSQAIYTYALSHYENFGAWPRPLLGSAHDPMLRGVEARMAYEYRAGGVVGFIKKEFHPESGVVFSELVTSPTAPHRRVLDPNSGREETYELTDNRVTAYTTGVAGDPPQSAVFGSNRGHLLQESDGRGIWTSHSRDLGFGKSTTVTRAVGTPRQAVMARSYTDPSFPFYLASETDYNGNMVTFVRDPLTQRVIRKNYPTPAPTPQDPSPEPVYEEFAYNAYGQLTSHRLANGYTESFEYFAAGSDEGHPTLVRVWTDPDRKNWTYGYDSLHRRTSVTDPRGHTTLFEYDLRDRVSRIVHPDGTWQEMEYDAFGNRTLLRDEAGAIWRWEYDQQNRLVSTSVPGAQGEGPRVTTYQYGSGSAGGGSSCSCSTVDQPTLITLPSGRQTRICYDLRWRKISETVGYGTADAATTHYTWEDNLVKTVTDPRSKVTTYFYDERGRRTKIVNPLGPVAGKWEFTYDPNGNLLTTVRPAGFGYTENAYDKLNRLVQTWDPKGQSVSYAYDSGSRRKLLRDPRGYDYTFEYNGRNKMTKFVYPGGSYEQWTYDDAGNKATYRTRGNVLATYVYDARNRQTAENWSDGVTPSVTRSFDEVGRPLTVVNIHSAINYTYHPGGELKTETQDVTGAGGPRTLTYAFDPDGRRSRLTYPSGLVLDYTYTGRGQLESIRANGQPPVVSYAYDGAGNRTLKTLENGTWTDYAYDDVNRVTKIDHRASATGGASFSRLNYGYNSVHSRTWIERDNSGRGDAFTYDEADQLIDAKFDALNPDTTPTGWTSREEFVYDSAGNRESYVRTVDGTVSESHSYGSANALNQYLSINGQSLSHNLAGSTTFDPSTGVSVTYDAKERPLNLTKSAGGPVVLNEKRDGNYRVVTRTVNPVTTYYFWDNWKLVEETSSSNATVSHVNGARIDEIIVRRRPDSMMIYYHQDAQQSSMVLTSQAGLPVERYSYLAYGQCTVRDGTGSSIRSESHYGNLYTFLGRQALFAGLYDFRSRVANSKLGQWSQADPIRFAARDSNIMRFLRNTPVRWIDPYGLDVDNSSDEWISVYPEDDLRAVLIPPGGRFVGGQEGFIVTPSAEPIKGRNYFKTVDFVNARYYGNGRAEAFPSIWKQFGQFLIGGWRADPFLPLTKPAHDNCIRYNDPDKDPYELNPDRDPWEPQTGPVPEDLLPVRK